MDRDAYLNPVQRVMRFAVPGSFATMYLAYRYLSINTPQGDDISKLLYAIKWQFVPLGTLFLLMIPNLAIRLGHSSMDYGLRYEAKADSLSITIKTNERIVTNTIEQMILTACGSVLLSTYLPAEKMKIIPILAGQFFVTRMLFAWGYHQEPNTMRAIGFGPLWSSNVALMLTNCYCFFRGGIFK